jgi:outer membrane scaffolding protein for murein synthesis (MipA/OmpV family)
MKTTNCLLAIGLIVATSSVATSSHAQDTLLGAGLRSRPDYDGSRDQVGDVVPVIRYYGPRWFARTTQGILEGGARTELDKDFWVGAQLAYEPPFDPTGISAGLSAGLHLEWDRKLGQVPLTFLLRARQHLDADQGGQADLRVTAGIFERRGLLAGVFGQATWGTENAVASRYGPRDAGLLHTSFGLLGSYELAPRWVLVGSIESRQLRDEASESPLAAKKSNYYATAGIAYRLAHR